MQAPEQECAICLKKMPHVYINVYERTNRKYMPKCKCLEKNTVCLTCYDMVDKHKCIMCGTFHQEFDSYGNKIAYIQPQLTRNTAREVRVPIGLAVHPYNPNYYNEDDELIQTMEIANTRIRSTRCARWCSNNCGCIGVTLLIAFCIIALLFTIVFFSGFAVTAIIYIFSGDDDYEQLNDFKGFGQLMVIGIIAAIICCFILGLCKMIEERVSTRSS